MARRGAGKTAGLTRRSEPDSKALERGAARARWDSTGALELWAERLRKIALGMTAALVTARAFWPSEPDLKTGASDGQSWILWLFITMGVALVSLLLPGRFRFRWSWIDLGVLALCGLIASSAGHALDPGPAIHLAWECAACASVYFLVRNLPRTRSESIALAAALFATAVATSLYGLYQEFVELPAMQAQFLRNPGPMLAAAHVRQGTPSEALFRDRLLYSSEIFSTFALANSLAGFLIGPLVLALGAGLESILRPGRGDSRLNRVLAVAPLTLVVAVCLVLCKSRSAWIGVAVALLIVAWWNRHVLSKRALVMIGAGVLLIAVGLAAAGVALGKLDREVLTQSTRSLRYRWEFWQGAWGVITEGATPDRGVLDSRNFWSGVGPGNFAGPYLRHKLPQSSEEILDPHNLVLEVWAVAGVFAALILVVTLAIGIAMLLRSSQAQVDPPGTQGAIQDGLAPGWLLVSAGAGWLVVIVLGKLNPFMGDLFFRWLILGAGWATAALLSRPLWTAKSVTSGILGAAVAGLVINLLAAGGIGIPTVAIELWVMLALGLNLADSQASARLREVESRLPAFALSCGWAGLIGAFLGNAIPYWQFESLLDTGDQAMQRMPPDLERAYAAYDAAIKAEPYDSRPWLGLAYVQAAIWESRGAKVEDERWKTIPIALLKAVTPPRNPDVWSLHKERAEITAQLLARIGPKLDPRKALPYQANIVEATRTASRLYPTNADLHARLALASAGISMFQDAAREAEEALKLDALTPHRDKKLLDDVRARLIRELPTWKEKAASAPKPTSP